MANNKSFLIIIICFLLNGCAKKENIFYGFIEGRYVYLSCEYSGKITNLFVKRGQYVNKGELLFKIDDEDEHINIDILKQKIEEARSNLLYAQQNFDLNKINLQRKETLNKQKNAPDYDVDTAKNKVFDAQNKLDIAQKSLHEAIANLSIKTLMQNRKSVVASHKGFINDEFYSLGEFVAASSPVISLLPEDQVHAVFFVSNSFLQKFKKGMNVQIQCENCPPNLIAKIDYIASSPEFTPPHIYSSNMRDELVFRVEAQLNQKDIHNLNVGQPLEVRLIE